jgi:NitT/TauT family transport system substrate-binding protein
VKKDPNILVASLLVLALALQACASPATEPAQPEPETLEVVFLPVMSNAPFFIAQEEGYFAEQNLEIELVQFERSSQAIPGLVSGEVDVIGGGLSVGLLNAMAQETAIKFVADKSSVDPQGCAYTVLMARRDRIEGGEFDDIANLEGLRISLNPVGFEGYMAEKLLESAGLTLDDLEVVDIPRATELDALEEGSLDILSTSEPWIARGLESGNLAVWMSDYEIIPNFQVAVVTYGPSLLEENRDAGKRFMIAYLKAARQYSQGKTERNLEIVSKYTELEPELLMQACWPPVRSNGQISTQEVLDFQAWAVAKGLQESIVPEDGFWDPEFVENATQHLDSSQP